MKGGRKRVAYIAVVIAFIAYLFSADHILNIMVKTKQEAKPADISLPPETKDIRYFIDDMKQVRLKWKEALSIRGWVFRENVKERDRDVFFVLMGNDDTLIFDIEKDRISRRDVTSYFRMGGDNHDHGFELALAAYRLKEKTYRIGFVIDDQTGRHYHMTHQSLVKTDGSWSVQGIMGSSLESLRSRRKTMALKEASRTATHHIDIFEDSAEMATIAGWGFLNGLDTKDIKHYLLFKNGDHIEIVSTIPQTREDVTAAFRDSKINLDKSGYLANVPKDLLPEGRYQIGLYIVKGEDQGMAFFDRYITID